MRTNRERAANLVARKIVQPARSSLRADGSEADLPGAARELVVSGCPAPKPTYKTSGAEEVVMAGTSLGRITVIGNPWGTALRGMHGSTAARAG